ncbi:hypothetical protein [Chroococcidiopsis sp. SAG 2025]|nr:hypothetical protein [Chroococcidiopsis sp. SAG 2025]
MAYYAPFPTPVRAGLSAELSILVRVCFKNPPLHDLQLLIYG